MRFSFITLIIATSLSRLAVAAPVKNQEKVEKDQPVLSTKFNFADTVVEGEKKLPTGSFLEGKLSQNFEQMIKLRRDFLRELRSSATQVDQLVKP